jgi:hypothetical protein
MTRLTLRYDDKTHRIVQTYWGSDVSDWADEQQDGTTVTTTETTQQARSDALNNTLNSVDAGTDYDPDTEVPVGKLCYDPDADELYGEVEIQPIQE